MARSNDVKLLDAGIPVDQYNKVMTLAEDLELQLPDEDEDPAEAFKRLILEINDLSELPSWLSDWCGIYGVDHNDMDLEPLDEELDL